MTLTATTGSNFIFGQKEAVLLGGSGKISVTSGIDSEVGNQEISLLAEVGEGGPYEGFNNAFIGGENGIHANRNCDGTFESDAKNNNYIKKLCEEKEKQRKNHFRSIERAKHKEKPGDYKSKKPTVAVPY